ncbi:MAG: precorrin-6y C5,15-methyltransferase (decarboxylating) subunit CbiE [SAR202 cluster bacterium Io17-Chloro-G9]|nr:MAG: precorrin-6y C5,15-methyltransferase (decarboxylating) subunit CbiE [SAR202 cluster bacterium Io17-Chloro-G9]
MTVVAVGPGDPRLLTLRGQQALREADLVVGFKTVLDVVQPWIEGAAVRPMSYRDQEEVLEDAAAQAALGRRCVVCCWGDLNVSARELLERVRRRVDQVELIPGISSVQIACARAGLSLEDVLFITLHQRKEPAEDLAELVHYLKDNRRHIILLPRPWDLMPAGIASNLLDQGIPAERPVTIFQRLTLDGEERWQGSLEACAALSQEFSDLSIMVFPVGTSPVGSGAGAPPENG